MVVLTAMASEVKGDNVDNISSLLEKTQVRQHNLVSFKSQGLKLETAEDAEDIIKGIRDSPDLQVLELSGNTIGVNAAKAIADSLKDRPELERCLWSDIFTSRLRSEIPPSLRALGNAIIEAQAHLVEFDLSDNAFGPDGVQACVELLKSEAAYTLEILKFNNNGLGIGGKILAETLIECHRKSSASRKPLSLKVFIAGRNRLENPGAIALAQAFETIGTLEEIQMPQNGITHEGITALARAVKSSPNLRHLNLNDNTFSSEGAIAMADSLKQVNNLEIINFGDCLVRTDGATAVSHALKDSNPNLRVLILAFGEIQLDGAINVCEAMVSKENLKMLDLNGNQLGEEGTEEIIDIAKHLHNPDALGSLSEDEGVDSEDEDDVGESDGEAEEVTTRANENGLTNGLHQTSLLQTLKAEDFPDNITIEPLVTMEESARENLLREAIGKMGKDVEDYVDACITISELLNVKMPNGEQTKAEEVVLKCVDQYLSTAFKLSDECPMRVLDRFFVKLGVIKSEDKAVKAVPEISHVVTVLLHAIKQSYYPANTKKTVRAMIAKSNQVWNKNIGLQNRLLKLLY